MKKIIKKIFYYAGATIVAVLIISIIAVKQINPNQYKSDIEKLLNKSTGLTWVIGSIDFSLVPLLTVTFNEVCIRAAENEILRAEKVRGKLHILPLVSRSMQIKKFEIINCAAHIEKNTQGKLNFIKKNSRSPNKNASAPNFSVKSLTVHQVVIENGNITYSDRKTSTQNSIDNLDCTLGSFGIIENNQLIQDPAEYIKIHTFKGNLAAEKVDINGTVIQNINSKIISKKGRIKFNPATAAFHEANLNTSLSIDLFAKLPTIELQGDVKNFNVEPILKSYDKEVFMNGALDISLQMTTKGLKKIDILQNLNGNISISGSDLVFTRFDIDRVLNKYEESQSINMFDIGGLLILGPFGPALSKGYSLSGLYAGAGKGTSVIKKLVSDWQIKNGIARASDVAFASSKNRVAAQGKLNLVRQKFDNFKVAILDNAGCERFSQTINGPFQKPEVKKAALVTQIFKPVGLAIRKSKKLIFKEKKCEPFYRGKVVHPVPK